jgi:hypothetical protein
MSICKCSWIALLSITPCMGAVFVYDEAISGDVSDNYLLPLLFSPSAGTSTIRGTISDSDRDLFTINIASGLSLDSIRLLSYTTDSENPENVSYLLSQPGAFLSAPPDNDFSDPIGYIGFGEWAEGREILRFLTTGPPYDYANKLGPGDYAFWVNETGPNSSYSFSFTVTENSVPEPSVFMVLLVSVGFLCRRSNRSH